MIDFPDVVLHLKGFPKMFPKKTFFFFSPPDEAPLRRSDWGPVGSLGSEAVESDGVHLQQRDDDNPPFGDPNTLKVVWIPTTATTEKMRNENDSKSKQKGEEKRKKQFQVCSSCGLADLGRGKKYQQRSIIFFFCFNRL